MTDEVVVVALFLMQTVYRLLVEVLTLLLLEQVELEALLIIKQE